MERNKINQLLEFWSPFVAYQTIFKGILDGLIIVGIFVARSIKVVPQQNAWVKERLGKYAGTLTPGLNFLVPFVDRVAYKHSLKEIPLDVPSQVCITRDNTQLQVDGILYFQVTDPMRASYGSSNYIMAVTQLAQTSLRSVIGKMELDRVVSEFTGGATIFGYYVNDPVRYGVVEFDATGKAIEGSSAFDTIKKAFGFGSSAAPTISDTTSVVPNTSTPGDPAYGWQYYSDGTAIETADAPADWSAIDLSKY